MSNKRTRSKAGISTEADQETAIAIGQNIKRERLRLNLSQATLAKKIGVPTNALQRYETGLVVIPTTSLITLADIFDVSIESLCTNNGTSVE